VLVLAACASAPAPGEDPCAGGDWPDGVRWPRYLPRPDPEVAAAAVRSVEELLVPDFRTRYLAAHYLVTLEETALPYLGHAQSCGIRPGGPPLDVGHVVLPILRRLAPDRLAAWYASPYPSLRAAAAACAAERRVEEHAPRLVELLQDPDEEVRLAAILGLRTIYNRFLGYDPKAGLRANREAVARWRAEATAR